MSLLVPPTYSAFLLSKLRSPSADVHAVYTVLIFSPGVHSFMEQAQQLVNICNISSRDQYGYKTVVKYE